MLMTRHMDRGLHARLVESLYVEAMVMADEARAYFSEDDMPDQRGMSMIARVGFSCESLKVTTRLMHVIAWLMGQRAWQRGEIDDDMAVRDPRYQLGDAMVTDPASLMDFPVSARALIAGSMDLYDRVARLQARMEDMVDDRDEPGPARALLGRLEEAF